MGILASYLCRTWPFDKYGLLGADIVSSFKRVLS